MELQIGSSIVSALPQKYNQVTFKFNNSMVTLTKREKEVYDYMVRGYSNQEIADSLFVVEKTIKFHVTFILKRLGTKSRCKVIAGHYLGKI